MYCSKCGREVASEERFCLICGSHEKQETPLRYGSGWYYLTGGEVNRIRGPLSESSMRKLFINGTLNGNTNIRFGTNSFWSTASEIPLFQDVVKTIKMPANSPSKYIKLLPYIVGGLLGFLIIYMKLFV